MKKKQQHKHLYFEGKNHLQKVTAFFCQFLKMYENEELEELRQQIEQQVQAVDDYEQRMEERNRQRIQYINENKAELIEGQSDHFKEVLNNTTDELSNNAKNNNSTGLQLNDIEMIREARSKLNQQAYTLLGIDVQTM